MQNERCKMKNEEHARRPGLRNVYCSAFCILHFAFSIPASPALAQTSRPDTQPMIGFQRLHFDSELAVRSNRALSQDFAHKCHIRDKDRYTGRASTADNIGPGYNRPIEFEGYRMADRQRCC